MEQELVSLVLSAGSLATLGLSVVVLSVLLSPTARRQQESLALLAPYVSLVFAAVAVSGSLYYSEIAQFIPCELCWFQRIAMYPLVPILLIALIVRDRLAYWYVLPISAVGVGISIYHYQLQVFPDQATACSGGVSCTARYVEEFGFISIPFMAMSAFLAILVLHLILLVDARRYPEPDD